MKTNLMVPSTPPALSQRVAAIDAHPTSAHIHPTVICRTWSKKMFNLFCTLPKFVCLTLSLLEAVIELWSANLSCDPNNLFHSLAYSLDLCAHAVKLSNALPDSVAKKELATG